MQSATAASYSYLFSVDPGKTPFITESVAATNALNVKTEPPNHRTYLHITRVGPCHTDSPGNGTSGRLRINDLSHPELARSQDDMEDDDDGAQHGRPAKE